MKKDEKYLVVEDISEGNKWVADLAQIISDACSKHRRGFIFVPFTHEADMESDNSPRTCLMTDLEPLEFMAAISGAIANYCRFRKELYSKIDPNLSFPAGSEMAEKILEGIRSMEDKENGK